MAKFVLKYCVQKELLDLQLALCNDKTGFCQTQLAHYFLSD